MLVGGARLFKGSRKMDETAKAAVETPPDQGGFDLDTASPVSELEEVGAWIELVGIEGEAMLYGHGSERKPVRMKVAGSYSKLYRKLTHAQTTKAVKRRTTKITGELLHKQRLEVISGCVLEWEGFYKSGVELPSTRENIKIVLDGFGYILEQVEAAIEDHEAFTGASSSV